MTQATGFGADLIGKTKKAKEAAHRARWQAAGNAAQALDQTVRWLVKERSWEVLGYENFSKAWEKECGFKCITHIQVLAVIALRDEGMNTRRGPAVREGLDGHTHVSIAKMVGLGFTPRGDGGHSSTVSIFTQLDHGVSVEDVTKANNSVDLARRIDEHGTVPYEPRASRKRPEPKKRNLRPTDMCDSGFFRWQEDALETMRRKTGVSAAEYKRIALDEYLAKRVQLWQDGAA